jgi:hypothetical protein
MNQLPARMSWWKIIRASEHRRFLLIQVALFGIGNGLTIAWAIWKHDLGTATGLGGFVFAIGSTINMIYDKMARSRGPRGSMESLELMAVGDEVD